MGSKAGFLCPCEKPVLASVLLASCGFFQPHTSACVTLFYAVRASLILAARFCVPSSHLSSVTVYTKAREPRELHHSREQQHTQRKHVLPRLSN